MWPSLLPNGNACDGMESSIQSAPICASLRITKASWDDLFGFIESEGERCFRDFSVRAMTLFF